MERGRLITFFKNKTERKLTELYSSYRIPGETEKAPATTAGFTFGYIVRFAVCAVVVVSVSLLGISENGRINGRRVQSGHELNLSVCAAQLSDAGKKASMHNLKINIPGAVQNGSNSAEIGSKPCELSCKGNGLETVTYTAGCGSILHFSNETFNAEAKSLRKTIVCQFEVKKYLIDKYHRYNLDNMQKNFLKLWNEGKFDDYRKKYLNGQNIESPRYYLDFEIGCRPGYIFVNDDPAKQRITVSRDVYVVTVFDNTIKTPRTRIHYSTKTVTVNAKEHESRTIWLPPDRTQGEQNNTAQSSNFAENGDTVYVKAVFKDGTVISKKIVLTYDKNGALCSKITAIR